VASPFFKQNLTIQSAGLTEDVLERLPRQILSLLKSDEPRLVVYAYGQSLSPAGPPILTQGPTYQMYTNYNITGEVLTKHVLRIEGTATNPIVVPERFQYVPNE
jgi:hypothetical protein